MDNRAVVLVVEDNERLLNANARVLEEAGYLVHTATDLASARRQLAETLPDAIVLDILLPDGSGLDFIGEIRTLTPAPVLLTTSLGSKDDRLVGLQAGGDDYISKPFDLDEMCARVGAFLRRETMYRETLLQGGLQREITRGPLLLDTVSGRAYLHGGDMQLAPKEYLVLLMFVQNEGKSLSAERLYETVWKLPMEGDDHSIKNVVYRLRNKLTASSSGLSIETVRGEGYRFVLH